MHILKSLAIAFSIYSKIPVPQFEWTDEDMKYVLCFFPWIGVVIGICIYLWSCLCSAYGIGKTGYALIGAALPIAITGGFHVDGFMDTMDALHSYQTRERKLEILKDSHIGAFAVIMLSLYGLVYIGAFSEITDMCLLKIVCGGFFLSRCLSGIGVVSFPLAKKDGMLCQFAKSAKKAAVKRLLYLQCAACVCFMFWQSPGAGMAVSLAAFAVWAYYYHMTKKEFGGITGDTAGWFVLVCEVCIVAAAAVINVFVY